MVIVMPFNESSLFFESPSDSPVGVKFPLASIKLEGADREALASFLNALGSKLTRGNPSLVFDDHGDLIEKWVGDQEPETERLRDETIFRKIVSEVQALGLTEAPPVFEGRAEIPAPLTQIAIVQKNLKDRIIEFMGLGERRAVTPAESGTHRAMLNSDGEQFQSLNAWLQKLATDGQVMRAIRAWHDEQERLTLSSRNNVVHLSVGRPVRVSVDGVAMSLTLRRKGDGAFSVEFGANTLVKELSEASSEPASDV